MDVWKGASSLVGAVSAKELVGSRGLALALPESLEPCDVFGSTKALTRGRGLEIGENARDRLGIARHDHLTITRESPLGFRPSLAELAYRHPTHARE
jgi:hypothetical protein